MEHAVDVLDGLGAEMPFSLEQIVRSLDFLRRQIRQRHRAEIGLDVDTDVFFIGTFGGRLQIAGVVPQPAVQPVTKQNLARFHVGAVVDLCERLRQLLLHFLLRFPVYGFLNLLSRPGIKAERVSRFPAPIGSFSDRPAPGGASFSFWGQCYLAFFQIRYDMWVSHLFP